MEEIEWIEVSSERLYDHGGNTIYVTTHMAEIQDGILLRTITTKKED
jgi:hypothetical protein